MEKVVSLHELDDFALFFWKEAGDTKVFAFHGQMGAGKTTTIAALCRAKGIEDATSSPTFSIINEYDSVATNQLHKILHIDLYRLKNYEEAVQAGVEDCVYGGDICFIEWPEKAPQLFDEKTMHVFIEPIDEERRSIKMVPHNEVSLHMQDKS
ncbi:MAG: tRNA (adenosine(37)-N6)-threonylcarbamoyltransferase complex ATPase subunit type 1 TsaE [Chitinophagaceae bacterium]